MLRVIVYLNKNEYQALQTLAEREYRDMRSQAAMLIRLSLERMGMLKPTLDGKSLHSFSDEAEQLEVATNAENAT